MEKEDYEVDEKHRQATPTDSGIAKAEKLLGIENLYDPANIEYNHHFQQALKAHTLFKLDRDYVVKDGEVIIVDEFTGRLMPGRRWSDGLHQAVEAKEGVKIESENQTLATVTFQNYFRMYKKLAGMTGTAETEAAEFEKIYNLEIVIVPTNRSLIRHEYADVVYRTEREKFNAVIEEIKEYHLRGQPVLVGSIAIEKSERLSLALKKAGVVPARLQEACQGRGPGRSEAEDLGGAPGASPQSGAGMADSRGGGSFHGKGNAEPGPLQDAGGRRQRHAPGFSGGGAEARAPGIPLQRVAARGRIHSSRPCRPCQ